MNDGRTDRDATRPSRSRAGESLRALDALNVVLADVRDGLGPYLAIYLATKHWDAVADRDGDGGDGGRHGARPDAGRGPDRPDPAEAAWMVAAAAVVAAGCGRDGPGADACR